MWTAESGRALWHRRLCAGPADMEHRGRGEHTNGQDVPLQASQPPRPAFLAISSREKGARVGNDQRGKASSLFHGSPLRPQGLVQKGQAVGSSAAQGQGRSVGARAETKQEQTLRGQPIRALCAGGRTATRNNPRAARARDGRASTKEGKILERKGEKEEKEESEQRSKNTLHSVGLCSRSGEAWLGLGVPRDAPALLVDAGQIALPLRDRTCSQCASPHVCCFVSSQQIVSKQVCLPAPASACQRLRAFASVMQGTPGACYVSAARRLTP